MTAPSRLRPALFDALSGYSSKRLGRDLAAGAVVGVVAIPLSLAFAIASGVAPESGLMTAIVAGFLISLLGGSRVQVGGPTGAFVVIVFGIVERYGFTGLTVATLMAGVILVLFGLFRLGRIIQFIPYPVVLGFTAGIGIVILLSQVREVFGLDVAALPGDTVDRLQVLWHAASTWNPYAFAVAMGTVVVIYGFKRFAPRVPGPVIALVAGAFLAHFAALPVETVGDRFGALNLGFPRFRAPTVTLEMVRELVPAAFTIALLGAIESLLSAVVADAVTETKHRPDAELVAQGIANLASPLFGGMPATGAIARTATNIQNGASSPVAGIAHAAVVLIFAVLLASTVTVIPLAVLAGILVMVSYHMMDVPRLRRLGSMPRGDAAVLLTTMGLTVFVDLVVAVEIGVVMAALLFMARMANLSGVRPLERPDDEADPQRSIARFDLPDGAAAYSVDGPFFFGAAERFESAMERVSQAPRVLIFRMRHVPMMDATGANTFELVLRRFAKRGTQVVLSAVQPQPLALMRRSGIVALVGETNVVSDIDAAIARARSLLADAEDAPPPQAPTP